MTTKNLHKNTKLALTATAVAAAVTTGAVTTTAHADAVKTNNNQDQATSQATQSQSTLKSAQDASRQNYADAKSANDSAQADVNSAQQAVTDAENAQTAASATNAQNDVAKQNAQDAVNQASDALKSAQDAAAKTATDSQAVSEASQAVDQATSANAQAQTELNQASDAVKSAEDASGKAQAAVNQAQSQASQAQTGLKDAQDAVKQASTDVNNAQNHQQTLSDAQQAVSDAQKQKDAADTKVNDAQNDVNTKQTAQTTTKTNLDNAKSALDSVQKNAPVVNHITVNDTYINELKKHRGQQTIEDDNTLNQAARTLYHENKYQTDPAAKATAVHFNADGTLSQEDTVYATQYAARLINEIRSQLGTPLVKINNGSVAIAQDVAKQYVQNHTNAYIGHDKKALDSVGSNWNTSIQESNVTGDQFGTLANNPDPNTEEFSYQGLTRDDLQRGIYNGIREFLFDDSPEWYGHTTDILGTRYTPNYNNPDQSGKDSTGYYMNLGGIYLGVSFEYDPSTQSTEYAGQTIVHPGTFHFISEWDPDSAYAKVVEQHVQNPETGNEKYRQSQWRQEIAIPTVTDQASAIKSAQDTVTKAQTAFDIAQSALTQAQTALNNAKTAQQSADNNLTKAQTNLQHVQATTPNLADAQAKLTAAQTALTNAKTKADNAASALSLAQTTKQNADKALTKAQDTLAGAKTKAANAATALKQANDKYNAVLGANKAVKDAQDALTKAQTALRVAESNSQTSAKALDAATQAVKDAQAKLASAKAHAAQTAKALNDAKNALITDAKVYSQSISMKGVTIHVGDALPNPEIANPMAPDPTQSQVMGAYLALAASKLDTIPTGTKAGWTNMEQLANDMQTVGNYQEDATVTFPDGSTTTVKVPLTVLAKKTTPVTPVNPSKPDHGKTDPTTPSKPTDQNKPTTPDHGKTDPTTPVTPVNPSKPTDQTTDQQAQPTDNTKTTTDTTVPSDAHIVNKQVVDSQGHVITGLKAVNGKIVASQNTTTSASANVTAPVASATTMTREQYKASQNGETKLPQTGNSSELGLLGLGLVTLAGMFGLVAPRRKN